VHEWAGLVVGHSGPVAHADESVPAEQEPAGRRSQKDAAAATNATQQQRQRQRQRLRQRLQLATGE